MPHKRIVFAKIDFWPIDAVEVNFENDRQDTATIRNERWNFIPDKLGVLRAFVRPAGPLRAARVILLESIDESAKKDDFVEDVLIVFFAKPEPLVQGKGHRLQIVGWFNGARVYRVPFPETTRFINDNTRDYNVCGDLKQSVLLPIKARQQLEIEWKMPGWIRYQNQPFAERAINFVQNYTGDNLFSSIGENKSSPAPIEPVALFISRAKLRKAIEDHAVEKAKAYYQRDYSVEPKGKPYDLLCTHKTTREVLFVEVKGTTTVGTQVLLTPNEVNQEFLLAYPNAKAELFVVKNIEEYPKDSSQVRGGDCVVVKNWKPKEHTLTASQYICELDQSKIEPA